MNPAEFVQGSVALWESNPIVYVACDPNNPNNTTHGIFAFLTKACLPVTGGGTDYWQFGMFRYRIGQRGGSQDLLFQTPSVTQGNVWRGWMIGGNCRQSTDADAPIHGNCTPGGGFNGVGEDWPGPGTPTINVSFHGNRDNWVCVSLLSGGFADCDLTTAPNDDGSTPCQ
jgi:hypothetical protein